MTTNMSKLDRGLRIVAAVLLLLAAFSGGAAASGLLHWLAIAIAVIFILTALVGSCPLYRIIGLSTFRAKQ